MFDSKKNKWNSSKGNLFSSNKKSGLNIGGGLSAGKQIYESSVAKRALNRAGKNKNLHGHVNEILTVDKFNVNPAHIIKGQKASLTKSQTAVRDDIIVKQGKKIVKRMQLKDTTSTAGLRDTVNKVKDHHYKGTILMGTKETAKKYAEKAAKDPGLKQKMVSNGISSDKTKLITAKYAGINAKGSGKRIVKESAKTGFGGATITAGIEAVKAGIDVKNGKKDIKSAAGTALNETVINTASAMAGDIVSGTAAVATTALLGPAAAPVVGIAAGVGASKITDTAIRTGESAAINKYGSGKSKKRKNKHK